MALNGTPHLLPVCARIDTRRERPGWPGIRLAFDAVDLADQPLERPLVDLPRRLGPGHVVQLLDGVRFRAAQIA